MTDKTTETDKTGASARCVCGEPCSVCAQREEIEKEGWDLGKAFAYGVVLGIVGASRSLRHFCAPCNAFMDAVGDRLLASAVPDDESAAPPPPFREFH